MTIKEFKGTKGKWSVGVAPEYNNTLKSAIQVMIDCNFKSLSLI